MANKKKKVKGMLPCDFWLRKNNLRGLVECRKKHPELFAHIDQEKKITSVDEYVSIAEELEKKHGKLPTTKWLKENGYTNLTACKIKHPEKFVHIKQNRINKYKKTKDEYVKMAEELEKEHGKLPRNVWLRNNGYTNLVACRIKHPKRFAHIKQEKFYRTLNEWVKVAEDLEKENDGVLPNRNYLQKKYSGLYKNILLYPEKFQHIQQEKRQNIVSEWVTIAEGLERKYGKLPNPKWLQNNKLFSLYSCMMKHPEKFAHIKQFIGKEFKESIRSIGV